MKVPSLPVTSFIKFTSTYAPESLRLGFISFYESTIEGLRHNLQAGLEAEFTVFVRTFDGEIKDNSHKDQVELVVQPAQQVASSMICERKDGNFQVKFTPKVPGTYSIEVKINGDKLLSSPLTVQVKERQFVVVGELDLKGETLQKPRGIAVNSEGKIVLTGGIGRCVLIFDREGSYLSKLGCHGSNPGQFNNAVDVTFLNDKEILVADELNHRIEQFNVETGKFVKAFGEKGSAGGEFINPVSVCTDDEGHVVVAEFNNSRIQVLTKDGEFLLEFGDVGPERLDHPVYCIYHKEMFIVSDSGNHCVKVFGKSGKFLYKVGEQGQADGQFKRPSGLCIDNFGNLLVCDRDNDRIQQFTLQGGFTGKSVTKIRKPWGITAVPDGRILVASMAANRVCICK